jgi:hypothetical protein
MGLHHLDRLKGGCPSEILWAWKAGCSLAE